MPMIFAVRTCLSAIGKSFYGVSWLLTKHGSNTIRHKWKNSQNSGLHPANSEGENGFIGRKDHDHRFLEFARHHFHRLFGEGKNNHRAVLCWFIEPIRPWIDEKTAAFGEEKSALSPWQRSSPICNCHSKTDRITLRIAASSIVFSRFGPMLFIFVTKHEKMAGWKAIHVKRGSHRRNRGLFCEVRQTIFFGWTTCIKLKRDYIEK